MANGHLDDVGGSLLADVRDIYDAVPVAIFKAVSKIINDAFNQAIKLQSAFSVTIRDAFAARHRQSQSRLPGSYHRSLHRHLWLTLSIRRSAIVWTFSDISGSISESVVSAIGGSFTDTTVDFQQVFRNASILRCVAAT
jgi:hypothetical protein